MRAHTVLLTTTALVAATLGTAGGWWVTQNVAHGQSSRVLEADQFRLVDFDGVQRARLGLSGGDQQYTYFYFMDERGRNRIVLTVYPDERTPTLKFLDARGETLSVLPQRKPRGPRRRISSLESPGGKADSARPEDIRFLQGQIDRLRLKMNQLIETVNRL